MKHNYISKLLLLFSVFLGGNMVLAQTFEQVLPPPPTPQIIPSIQGVNNSSIAFADIDGDNDQDVLVTGNSDDGAIAKLYRNDGTGNYTEVTGTPFEGVHTGSIAFADIDGDNDQDVLITGRSGSYQSISRLYKNDGAGNYTEIEEHPFTGVYRSSIAFADIDGDNDQDVLITGYSANNESISELFKNDGDGGFVKITGTPFTGVTRSFVAFADVDNDNDQDVLIMGIDASNNRISKLYKNDGDGNYSESTGNSFTGVQSGSITFADVDGDNDQDVLITGYSSNNVESSKLYVNNGAGNFSEATGNPFEPVQSGSVAFADVDSDGDQDVLITGRNTNGKNISKLYENGGSGTFTEATGNTFTGVNNSSIAFADVNGDSHQDVLITGENSSKLYINDSSGNFLEATGTFFEAVQNGSVAFADVDGDTDLDVLITGSTSSRLYENDGAGNYILVSGNSFAAVEESSIAFADIDGDGDQDVLITGRDDSWNPISRLYRNLGGGNYEEVAGAPFTGVSNGSIAFADVDKDGDQDVLITGNAGNEWDSFPSSILYLNDGFGNFSEVTNTSFAGVSNGSIAFADVNGDGDQDVLMTGRDTNGNYISKLYKNDGDGNFSEVTNTSFTGVQYGSIAFADIDGDSDQDVLITGLSSDDNISKLYENNGNGVYSEVTEMPFAGVRYSSIAFADIDGDADQDVLITGVGGNGPSSILYRNTSVNKKEQTITFSAIAAKTYGQNSFELGDEFSSEGLPVTYTAADPSIVSIDKNIATILTAGSTTITATQEGNETTFPAEEVSRTLTVNKAELVITADEKLRECSEENPELTYSYSGLVNGDTAIHTPPNITTTAAADSSVGTYPIILNGAADPAYEITYQNALLNIVDSVEPTFTMPEDILEQCETVVEYDFPTASDNCQTYSIDQVAGLPSGDLYEEGVTTNSFRFIEESGTTANYDFENLSIGETINEQGNWLVAGSRGPSYANVQEIPSSGSYEGGQALVVNDLGASNNIYISRVNDTNFTFPSPGEGDVIEVTFDHSRNYWGSYMAFGSDNNGDGHISDREITFGIFDRSNQNLVQVYGPDKSILGSISKSQGGWTRWKLRIDLTANSGKGSIDVSYKDLVNNGSYVSPKALQNLEPNFDISGTGSVNPRNINGMLYRQEAGGGTRLDNIQYAVKKSYTRSFTVTVEDTQDPEVITQNISVVLDENGQAVTTAEAIDNNSTDNCGINTLSLSKTDFDCSNVGENTVVLTVTDVNGNQATAEATVTVVDDEAPTAVAQDLTIYLDENGKAVTSADAIDNNSTDNCGIDTLSLSKTDFDCSNVGENTVVLTVTDVNGNQATAEATVTVVDNTAPIAKTQDITVQLDAEGKALITPEMVDNASNDVCGVQSLSLDVDSFDCSNVGENPVVLTVTDNSGNTSNATATVTVEDNSAPVAKAKDITVQLDAEGKAAITPAMIENGSSDACGIASFSLDVDSFNCSNIGENPVVLTITDNNGNTSNATATVTVEDNRAPVAKTQDISLQLDAEGKVAITPQMIDNGSSDTCGILSLSLDIDTFNCSNIGENKVVLTVTDNSGNTSNATATVTIKDNTAPVAKAQNITVQLDAQGNAAITPAMIDDGSSDACGIASFSLDVDSFNCSNIGTNKVVLTVIDNNGNSSSAEAVVTVEDKVAPVALARDITVELDVDGNASITPKMIDNGSNDTCGVAGLSLNKTSFDCSDVGNNTVVLTVTDTNGNSSSVEAMVTIEDNIAPEAIARNITIQLDAQGNASITPQMLNDGSKDSCGSALYSLDVDSFDCSNIGPNKVVLSVTDNSGNSSSAEAVVTIEDKVAPVAIGRNITIQLDENGTALITPEMIENGSTDACGITNASLDVTSFNCSNVGDNQVTLSVTDENGNTGTAQVTVTVEDIAAPVVIAKDITVELDETGNVNILPQDLHEESIDNCGIASMSLDKSSFSCEEVGEHFVTLTVTDHNGNSASAEAVVTVINLFGDNDNDGLPDNCDEDDDNDGVPDSVDNAVFDHNPDQMDTDGNGIGDVIDPDDDGDGVLDEEDNCPLTYNPGQEDIDRDGKGDVCDTVEVLPSQAMTPNGDGVNDTWRIVNIESHPNSHVLVYNQWGKVVFEAHSYQNDWNGRYKGDLLPEGSYYYQIDLEGDRTIDADGWLYLTK